jgi:hypothetical protein
MESAMPRLQTIIAAIALLASLPATAHEFWLWPEPFAPAIGARTRITLNVGEYFSGDLIGFAKTNVAAVRHYASDTSEDLRSRVPDKAVLPDLKLAFPRAGTHLIAFDSQPSQITLPAEKFHAYLHDEGLDSVIRQRETSGAAHLPGRERYRRNVKSLLRVGGQSDAAYGLRTGQQLEILPLADPFDKNRNEALDFQLLFDGTPLADALVKAWHKRDGQTLTIRARSTAEGVVRFTLPYDGPWMISVVHMIPATGSKDIDWDSFWGNLTFELPPRATAMGKPGK